ncbi:indole-3-glycerol phosphate synthase TrpC [Planctomycetota bacterium]
MANILDEIVAYKRTEIAQDKERVSQEDLVQACAGVPRCRNFVKAVTKVNPRGINVIAEVKKASPSAGLIRSDFDAASIARTYEDCGADAISVLTDAKYFQGSLDYLNAVKQVVKVPVMRKEFIVDPYQVYEARAAGADAILLIADILPVGELSDLMILATELTLSVLLEVYSAEVLMQVRSLIGFPEEGYSVLGVNNRDLATMQIDIGHTGRMAGLLDDDHHGLVAESGVKTRADVEKLMATGATAILIGQTLCEHPDIAEKFAELFGPSPNA